MQKLFSPTDYTFKWTQDWYTFDHTEGKKLALAARRKAKKELVAQGYKVRLFSLGKQRISKGGIGSGKPHIDVITSVYGLEAWR